ARSPHRSRAVLHLLFREFRHDVAPGARDALHRARRRGADRQELAAYNPLVPQGDELVATVMIEIEDAAQREKALSRLGGIEDHMFLTVGGERVSGIADPTRENTSPEGKASSVQFLRFPLTARQKTALR